jgi:hypothetical protein
LKRQKPPRTRPIAWRIPRAARITAHAGSEHLLRPSPCRSDTLTHWIVRCALPWGIPIFFGAEKSIPHPGPLPPWSVHRLPSTVHRSLITDHWPLITVHRSLVTFCSLPNGLAPRRPVCRVLFTYPDRDTGYKVSILPEFNATKLSREPSNHLYPEIIQGDTFHRYPKEHRPKGSFSALSIDEIGEAR